MDWQRAQKQEGEFWGNCTNTYGEEEKQLLYANRMGLVAFHDGKSPYNFDLGGGAVLDIGGGPTSLLLKCINCRGKVVDPLHFPGWVLDRYALAGIEFENISGEDIDEAGWDEAWIYNVLQHTKDPQRIITNARQAARLIRIFEWIDTPTNEGHPHSLAEQWLNEKLHGVGRVEEFHGQANCWGRAYYGIFPTDQYLQPQGQSAIQLMGVQPRPQPLRYPIAIRNQQPQSEITVTITSCGRLDLLRRTVSSLLATVGQPVKIVLIDDSEDEEQHRCIIVEYGNKFDIYIFGQGRGQAWCLDHLCNVVDTPYIFHCEDDWEFKGPGYLQLALEVLKEDKDVLAVSFVGGREEASIYGLVGPEHATSAGTKYYDRLKWWRGDELGYWHGWTSQPCLKRRSDWLQIGMFQSALTEAEYDTINFKQSGKKTVWLEQGYAYHLGEGQSLYKGEKQMNWLEPMWKKKHKARTFIAQIRNEETPQAERLADILLERYHPRSVIDLGCADGLYLVPFAKQGVQVTGIDIAPYPDPQVSVQIEDLRKPLAIEKHDLALCLEVVEHIEEAAAPQLVQNIVNASDTIIFSAARPGQGGDGHINCQPKDYWLERFREHGFLMDPVDTEWLVQRISQGYHLGWLPQNVMVLRRQGTGYRFHMLGVAHLPTHPDITACAYTQKIVKLCKMLKGLGHTVYFYGVEGSEVECDESITVVSQDVLREVYGDYDWHSEFFKFDQNDEAFQTFNRNAIAEINQRKRPRDFLLCPFGHADKPIADAVGLMAVETGIGYYGFFSQYRIWESYAWMHLNYGRTNQNDGSWYDAVIPNYFDPADFDFCAEKEDWFLYIGRLTQRKGVDVAVQVTRELGVPLKIAGQGKLVNPTECLNITDPHVEFVGYADADKRRYLMSKAKAVFVPTYYIEPFGGVAVEAQLSGTPVITTDWGAFSESVLDHITGFRCRTFDDFVWAAQNVDKINPQDCRDWAIRNFSMERIALMYQHYFEQLQALFGEGWYARHARPEPEYREWLRRYYPEGAR